MYSQKGACGHSTQPLPPVALLRRHGQCGLPRGVLPYMDEGLLRMSPASALSVRSSALMLLVSGHCDKGQEADSGLLVPSGPSRLSLC
jgi:hypothetical protein